MDGTPRRAPGGFPTTPQTRGMRSSGAFTPQNSTPSRPNVQTLPQVPRAAPQTSTGPMIPAHVLDPAQQRMYAFGVYVALWAWRLYDFYSLAVNDEESIGLTMKWMLLDLCFFFGLPLMEIPWLEWGNWAAILLFMAHGAVDVILMLRVGIPLQAWAISLVAAMWDRELTISEHRVKPAHVLHNASLILGKQIINVLPEGSAVLNPDKLSFCLNATVTQLEIPIVINQTEPIEIEILRIDLATNQNETLTIKKKALNNMLKKARKSHQFIDSESPLELHFPVTQTGIYFLQRVLDESKLEVRPRSSSAVVAACPQARVKPTGNNRCRNDLSDVSLEVFGIPPLRLKYRTSVGERHREATELQGLIPDGYNPPLSKHTSQALIRSSREDVSWAQSQIVTVALNETLGDGGVWAYALEEVTDGLGNFVSYVSDDEEYRPKPDKKVTQSFTVHDRPSVKLSGCSVQEPMRVAKGKVAKLPLLFSSTGKHAIEGPHTIEYLFTRQADVQPDGDHSSNAQLKKETLRTSRDTPMISTSGLYSLKSVSTEFCKGEVLEPASCLLENPPEPELSITHEDIVDKCAGNPIGLRVGLDLIGSPPFTIKYRQQKAGKRLAPPTEIMVNTLRTSIELTPKEAGHYTYTFLSIEDWTYEERPLRNLELIQDVKPSASAYFIEASDVKQACIDDTVEFDIGLRGEGPWKLEYELVHNGKRTKHNINIEDEHYTIKTQKLKNGGEYTLSLASITDKMGCKEALKAEAKVNVRHERPKAYFGHIDGQHAVMALEGKSVELPLRLTGSSPWTLEYKNLDSEKIEKYSVRDANAKLHISIGGTYQLLSVRDSVCPGNIDPKANKFDVGWIPRPTIIVPETSAKLLEGGKYTREAVCEGDDDSFDVTLSGNAPFDLAWEQHSKDQKSGRSANMKKGDLQALGGSASIRAETGQAGTYEYRFVRLADMKYDHSPKHFSPVVVQQTVNSRPNARFNSPGKTYSYCSREADGEEVIPMTLGGVPPFYLEVEIKHYGTPKPEISIHKNIASTKFDLKIEHRKLHLGHSTISIRKIRDARGCTLRSAPGGPRVQISVHDAPAATAMEDRTDFCVGDRLSFALGGQAPFTVYYTFEKQERKAPIAGTTFRRLAELPGTFTLTGLRDSASDCLASINLTKQIHPIPSVRLSGGQVSRVDIHEGGGTDLEFQFWGTPPFEFTYTRSTNAHKGRKSKILEIRTEMSHEHTLSIPVQDEGTYEVVSIKDRWCSFAKPIEGIEGGVKGQKLLQY